MSTRKPNALRPTTIEPYPTNAPGSILITQGDTRVLCTASIAEESPRWMIDKATGVATRGWVTAEYAMLPGSTNQRKRRGTDSRATEIQRLIGRVLRAAVDLEKMAGLTITCDCDVLSADGGTRTAAITGAYVALSQALSAAAERGLVERSPLRGNVAAVSVGIVAGTPRLDLDYELDVAAAVDMNVAMNHKGDFIEVQGTGEQGTFTRDQLDDVLDLAAAGIRKLMTIQRKAIRSMNITV